jgi:hypothetical protein
VQQIVGDDHRSTAQPSIELKLAAAAYKASAASRSRVGSYPDERLLPSGCVFVGDRIGDEGMTRAGIDGASALP